MILEANYEFPVIQGESMLTPMIFCFRVVFQGFCNDIIKFDGPCCCGGAVVAITKLQSSVICCKYPLRESLGTSSVFT